MKDFFEYPEGATPLNPNEMSGLIPKYISTQGELNLLEQENILEAERWSKKAKGSVLNDSYIRDLHKRMFDNVWRWAGEYRGTGKNIGVSPEKIREELLKLCADAEFWIQNKTYAWDEIGARFHHRIVCIHAFPNGNGRHARLMTDVLLQVHQQSAFTWGMLSVESGRREIRETRKQYIAALRGADQRKFQKLIEFVRS